MSRRLISGLVLATLCVAAQAHTGADAGAHHGFAAGFAHPFTGIDHLLAMLAVGLWSALATPAIDKRMLAWPLSFASTLLAGAVLGAAGVSLPLVEPAIVASVLILGLAAVMRARLSTATGSLLVAAFALFHGIAHGSELSGAAALAGMVVATALLHAIGLGLGVLLRTRVWPGRAAH